MGASRVPDGQYTEATHTLVELERGRSYPVRVSTIILTYNEERSLPDCLQSLKELGGEIFVVDSGSTDRTREIAEDYGAKVVEHAFVNYAAQRNWAQENLPIRGGWVLHLDADERLTPELVTEIKETLGVRREELGAGLGSGVNPAWKTAGKPEREKRFGDSEIDGFLLRKRTIFMGRWIRHGGHYPSYHLRLFRRGQGCCEDRLYDQHFLVNGKIKALKHDYIDVLTPNIDTWIQRHTRWAELEARQLVTTSNGEAQVRADFFGNPIERKRWLRNGLYGRSPLFARAFFYWLYRYFFRLGFLDGKEGFIFHFLQGFWFRLLVDIKIEEMKKTEIRRQTSAVRNQRSEVRDRKSETGLE